MDPRLAVLDRTPPPPPLDLVAALLDTWFGRTDTGEGDEGMGTVAELAAWCRAHGEPVTDDEVGPADLALAHDVRAGMRAVIARHGGGIGDDTADEPAARERLDVVAGDLRLRVLLADGQPHLEPDEDSGVRRLLAAVVAAPLEVDDRTWRRLKACRDPRCRTAFYDGSRNGSGVWCAMAACGAEAKQAAFIARRRVQRATARRDADRSPESGEA